MVPKTPEIAGKDFCKPEQCRRNSGGAWVHTPPPVKTNKLVDRDRLLLLFSSVPAVHLPVTCKVNQQHKQFRLSFFQICHGLFWVCFVADQLLLLILFSLVPCTGSKECWRLATGGEGDRLLLLVAGLWALLKVLAGGGSASVRHC
jgi:hypothetical protein